jgi:hypothetical protein
MRRDIFLYFQRECNCPMEQSHSYKIFNRLPFVLRNSTRSIMSFTLPLCSFKTGYFVCSDPFLGEGDLCSNHHVLRQCQDLEIVHFFSLHACRICNCR